MAQRVSLLVDLLAYESTQVTNDPKDATKAKVRVEESAASELFRHQQSIPDSTVDLSIDLPDANTDYLLIFMDQTVSIKLNGSGDSLTLSPKIAGTKSIGLVLKGDITQLQISNSSGTAANVDIIAINV